MCEFHTTAFVTIFQSNATLSNQRWMYNLWMKMQLILLPNVKINHSWPSYNELVNETLPIQVNDEDIKQNPQFAKLLTTLAKQVITKDGFLVEHQKQLDKVRSDLYDIDFKRNVHCWKKKRITFWRIVLFYLNYVNYYTTIKSKISIMKNLQILKSIKEWRLF